MRRKTFWDVFVAELYSSAICRYEVYFQILRVNKRSHLFPVECFGEIIQLHTSSLLELVGKPTKAGRHEILVIKTSIV